MQLEGEHGFFSTNYTNFETRITRIERHDPIAIGLNELLTQAHTQRHSFGWRFFYNQWLPIFGHYSTAVPASRCIPMAIGNGTRTRTNPQRAFRCYPVEDPDCFALASNLFFNQIAITYMWKRVQEVLLLVFLRQRRNLFVENLT